MKRLSLFFLIVLFVLAGCAPAAAPTAAPAQIAAATSSAAQRPQPTKDTFPTQAAEEPRAYVPTATAGPAVQEPLPAIQPTQGEQPRTNAQRDHLSTFALDVDTASYTQARQALLNGTLPDAEAVRVEEFVNFFRQDYPTPKDVAFGIYADGAPSPFMEDSTQILRFGIQGYRENAATRKPRRLTFVIDVSGSMGEPGKLELVKQTIDLLLQRLDQRDVLSVVVYNTQAWQVISPTNAAKRDWIMDAVNGLSAGGSTNLALGLQQAYEIANMSYRSGAINRVILCTDGVANTGDTNPDSIVNMVNEYAGKDITLTALGFGMGEYNDSLLEKLADKGNGNYAYIDTIDEAQRLFIDKLASTLDVIAMNAKVQVDFNPDVVRDYRQLGYEDRAIADQSFRNDSVDAGEIGAGHSVTALYEVHLKPGAEGRIATVQLRWEDPQSHKVTEINGNFNTWDMTPSFDNASVRYQQDVIAAYFAGRLKGAGWAQRASWDILYQDALRVSNQLGEDADLQELVNLIDTARSIDY